MAMPAPIDDRVREAISRPMTVVDITTAGRKSGEPRRLEIVLHNIGGRLYISGQPSRRRRSWLANLDADPKFILHVKRGARADLPATAREITDPQERRQVLAEVARHWKRDDVDVMVQFSPLIEVTV
ncbi:MAG: nitroreductase family deazaflavin-dependent oxidoreductase [Chloroflexi bacterium]|nr:MAG: nitroreductase family deazaflavin-dependent oxidoreductase [Chloroflexota bacterium]